jgi:hypothetical protein
MKAYLGILDSEATAVSDPNAPRIFGIDARQKNFRRVRLAA